MHDPQTGWSWFEDRTADAGGGAPNGDDMATAMLAARCFSTNDGEALLEYLRSLTTARVLGPDASDTMLRHLEGQRQLIAYLNLLIARGRTGVAAQTKLERTEP